MSEARVESRTPLARRMQLHRRMLAGEGGAGLACLRAVLRIASLPYGAAARLKNLLYRMEVLPATRVGARVVCVGNLTTGGTGKTPLVIHLARSAARLGLRAAIVTRGYAREGAASDEVALYRRRLPGVPVVVGADRVAAAREAVAAGAELVLLDDGFQHRRLGRDADVVLLDAADPFAGGLLPAGLLREPAGGLARAHVAVLTRCDRADAARLDAATRAIRAAAGHDMPVLREVHSATALVSLDGAAGPPLESLRGRRVLAFSGIGDPRALPATLAQLGAGVASALDYGDHHAFGPDDVGELARAIDAAGVDCAVTTEKDAVRLPPIAARTPVYALAIEAVLRSEDDRVLDALLRGAPLGGREEIAREHRA